MLTNKYVPLLSLATLLVAASSVEASECAPPIPTDGSTLPVPCGPSSGAHSVGKIKYNGPGLPNGSFVFYEIDLKSGISTNAYPVASTGTADLPKKGGGICPEAFDNTPGSPSPVKKDCELATPFSAKRYRVTVG